MKLRFLLQDKRAVESFTENALFYLFIALPLAFALFTFAYLVSSHIATTASIPTHLEMESALQIILETPNCLAYQNSQGIVFETVLDHNKFTLEQLRSCYPIEGEVERKSRPNFEFTLVSEDYSISTEEFYSLVDRTYELPVLVAYEVRESGSESETIHISTELLRIQVQDRLD